MSRRPARRSKLAGVAVLALVVSGLVLAALKYDGAPIHDVDLNDGGVWVTNAQRGMIARLNTQVQELDLGVVTSKTGHAVYQRGSSVQAFDSGAGATERSLHLVDTLRGSDQQVPVGGNVEAAVGDGVAAFVDTKSGRAWVRRLDQLDVFNESTPADAKVSPHAAVTVTRDGTALILDSKAGKVRSWSFDAVGTLVEGKAWDFDGTLNDDVQLTAVGERPVIAQAGKVLIPGEDDVEIPGAKAAEGRPFLQEVGPEDDSAYAATDEGLWRIPLGGGDAEEVSGLEVDGRPAPPLVLDSCVHGAWADETGNNYTRVCEGEDAFTGRSAEVSASAELVFRSNRDLVVLNDIASGNAWMVQVDGLQKVSNWDSVDSRARSPQQQKQSPEDEKDDKNQRPKAIDDQYGARAGKTVVLPVTLNDEDADGDILTVTDAPPALQGTTFSIVGNGTQIQATLPASARPGQTIGFDYQITDGWEANAPSTAHVTLTVVPEGRDTAPVPQPRQKTELTVAVGAKASLNVLPAWIDPDGDPLVLTRASTEDGEVDFRPDGTITFTDDGDKPGAAKIKFTVQGRTASKDGVVAVKVMDPDTARPTAVPDRFTGSVGSGVLLEPLENDTDPLGSDLLLPRVDTQTPGGDVVVDTNRGTATFRAPRAGSYYLSYVATGSNGRSADPKAIRVDITEPDDDNLPPVPTRDIAVMRADAPTLVDVLSNDTDPDDDVLVVQGVSVPREQQGLVKASLIEKRYVRVETLAPLGKERPELTYLLSDGRGGTVEGTVALTPTGFKANRPPAAEDDDNVTARAGTLITIPVTDNDEDPDGDELTVSQADLSAVTVGGVEDPDVPAVATGDGIRVLVPQGTEARELQLTYGVRDPGGLRDDAHVVIQVLPDTATGNRAPDPRPIVERTVTGQSVRVPVDVFGADPDGDPVAYAGIDLPPTLGRIGRSGSNWFEYEPYEDPESVGTDTFRVRVVDAYGKEGVAQVRMGVAPRTELNQVPAALNDELVVKPGRTIRYPVLENDSDPDGDRLSLVRDALETPKGVTAKIVGSSIELEAPSPKGGLEAAAVAQYGVTDRLGVDSLATLTVIGRQDAPDYAPRTNDDVVKPAELRGKSAGDSVEVDVLANDGDLDGARSEMVLEAMRPKISGVSDGKLRVELGKKPRVVPYRVVDGTDEFSYGFVYVPGAGVMPPTLDTSVVPITVTAGRERRVHLDDIVVVRSGRSPRIARLDTVETTQGHLEKVDEKGFTFTSSEDYSGPASVAVEVTDGAELNDRTGLLSQLTIPINVVPAKNLAPEARSVSLVMLAGEERPRTIDLGRLVTDPNPEDELTYEVKGGDEGLDVEQDGSTVSLRTSAGAPSSKQEITVTATDTGRKSTTATLYVEVVALPEDGAGNGAGAMPLAPMTLQPLVIPDADVGETVKVDVTTAILADPLPKATKKITSSAIASGKGAVRQDGTTLYVTPGAKGGLMVTYKLSDGSGQSARDAVGQVTVVAAGRPDAPGRPRAEMAGPGSVRLSWSAPADNGRPLTGYTISYDGGSTPCKATTCTVKGLRKAHEYTFTVSATNQVGEGPRSRPSNPITPDVIPEQMAAPRILPHYNDRNGRLHLVWAAPRDNGGSTLQGYEFQALPRTAGGQVDKRAGAGSTAMVWKGLRNGTQYSFRVRARNAAGAGPWSAASAPGMPFTRPSRTSVPDLQSTDNGGDNYQGYLEVKWGALSPPANGYDPVTGYQVRVLRHGRLSATVDVPATKQARAFTVSNGYTWVAKVRARNRAGWGPWSAPSAEQYTYDQASPPRRIGVDAHCASDLHCRAKVTNYLSRAVFTTPGRNGGFPIVKFTYRTSDGRTGTISRGDGRTYARSVEAKGRIVFATPRWPNQTGLRIRVWPWTQLPNGNLVRGRSGVSGYGFRPWARPRQPTPLSRYAKAVMFDCSKGNGRQVWPKVAGTVTTGGYRMTVYKNSFGGCKTVKIWWDYPPRPGKKKCAVILVRHSKAWSTNSAQHCTLVG